MQCWFRIKGAGAVIKLQRQVRFSGLTLSVPQDRTEGSKLNDFTEFQFSS